MAVFFVLSSCTTKPKENKETVRVQTSDKPVTEQEVVKKNADNKEKPVNPEDEIVAEFDGVVITKKDKALDKSEIEVVISKLNAITANKDYFGWLPFLSDSYKREFSNPVVLRQVSKSLPGIAKGIELKDLQDYFKFVFVPSRQKVRVDDIIYKSPTKIQVIKKESGKSLIFYDLEKIKGKWLLVPSR